MISKQYKFIFIPIPKCAGTTVRSVIQPYSDFNTFQSIYGDDRGKGLSGKIFKKIFRPQKYFQTLISNPQSHIDLVKELTEPDYFMFSFVRNPYDRAVSLWKYLQPKLSFPQFLDWLESNSNKSFHDRAHILPFSFYLELYKDVFSNSYVGRIESINDEFKYVCNQLGLPNLNLPRLNKTQHLGYKNYYNQESIEKINKIYRQDFDLFDYEF